MSRIIKTKDGNFVFWSNGAIVATITQAGDFGVLSLSAPSYKVSSATLAGITTISRLDSATSYAIALPSKAGTLALNPMTVVGDLIIGGTVADSIAATDRLAAVALGGLLQSGGVGAAPTWLAAAGTVDYHLRSGSSGATNVWTAPNLVLRGVVTTLGDLIYCDSTANDSVTRLAAGTINYVLKSGGAGVAPAWGQVAVGEMAAVAANTVLGNATGSSAAPAASTGLSIATGSFSSTLSCPAITSLSNLPSLTHTPTANTVWTTGSFILTSGINVNNSGEGLYTNFRLPTSRNFGWTINDVMVGSCVAAAWTFGPTASYDALVHTMYGKEIIYRDTATVGTTSDIMLTLQNKRPNATNNNLKLDLGFDSVLNYSYQNTDATNTVEGHKFRVSSVDIGYYNATFWRFGKDVASNYVGGVHKIAGNLAVATPTTPNAASSGQLIISANCYVYGRGNRYQGTTLAGFAIQLGTPTSDTSDDGIRFFSNLTASAVGDASQIIATANAASSWVFGIATYTGGTVTTFNGVANSRVQFGTSTGIFGIGRDVNSTYLITNTNEYNGATYVEAKFANRIQMTNTTIAGYVNFDTAPVGTIGGAVSWTTVGSYNQAGAWSFPVSISAGIVNTYYNSALGGAGVANAGSVTYTGYIIPDSGMLRVSVLNIIGANNCGASAEFLVGRYGTSAVATIVVASGYALTVNGSYQLVLTNNTGGTRYPYLSITRVG